ncbi:MAG: flippase [Candidatus Woesearchaeota archaeon]
MEKFGVKKDSIGFDYVKNTSWVTASKVVESLISYVIVVLISRYLGAEGLGQYSFIFSFVGLFFVFSHMGLTAVLVKVLSKDYSKADKYVSTVYRLRLLLALAVLVVYAGSLVFVSKEGLMAALLLAGGSHLFGSLFGVSQAVLRINHEGKRLALVNIVERIVALVGALVVLPLTQNLTLFVGVLVFGKFLQLVFGYVHSNRFYKEVGYLEWGLSKSLIRQGWPFLLVGFFSIIYVRLDTVMLSFMKSDVVVGWYQAGYKFITLVNFLPVMLMMFGFPLFSRFLEENKQKARDLLEKLFKVAFFIMFPLITGVWLVGGQVLELIYSFDASEAFLAFKILIIAELFVFLTTISGFFIASDNQKRFAKIAGIGAGVNVVLNLLLIPKFSLYGAGVATLVTYALMFFLMVSDIRRKILKFNILKGFWRPLLATTIMGLLVWPLKGSHLVFVILVGSVSYLVLIFVLYKASRKRFFL